MERVCLRPLRPQFPLGTLHQHSFSGSQAQRLEQAGRDNPKEIGRLAAKSSTLSPSQQEQPVASSRSVLSRAPRVPSARLAGVLRFLGREEQGRSAEDLPGLASTTKHPRVKQGMYSHAKGATRRQSKPLEVGSTCPACTRSRPWQRQEDAPEPRRDPRGRQRGDAAGRGCPGKGLSPSPRTPRGSGAEEVGGARDGLRRRVPGPGLTLQPRGAAPQARDVGAAGGLAPKEEHV